MVRWFLFRIDAARSVRGWIRNASEQSILSDANVNHVMIQRHVASSSNSLSKCNWVC